MKKIILMLSVLMVTSMIPQVVEAKKKVVLLPFHAQKSKKASKKIRNFIKKILKQNYGYITKKHIKEQMGKDIDFNNVSAQELKEISEKFEITAYIGGKLEVKGRRKTFTILVYSWETGEPILSEQYKFRTRRPKQSLVETITAKCLEAIEGMKEYTPPVKEEETPEVAQVVENEKPEVLEKPVTPKKKEKKKEVVSGPVMQVSLLQGTSMRFLDFQPATEPYYKTTSLAWTIALNGNVYPYAFVDKSSFLSKIGIGFDFAYLPGFTTYPANDKSQTVDTTVLNFSFDLRYKQKLTETLTLVPYLGYAKRMWTFASNDILDVPGVNYSTIKLGTNVVFSVSKKAKLEGGLHFYLPMDAGDIAKGDYYGEASLFGFGFNTAFAFNVIDQLDVLGGFEYTHFSFSFNGYGAREADSATDKQMMFFVGARYSY